MGRSPGSLTKEELRAGYEPGLTFGLVVAAAVLSSAIRVKRAPEHSPARWAPVRSQRCATSGDCDREHDSAEADGEADRVRRRQGDVATSTASTRASAPTPMRCAQSIDVPHALDFDAAGNRWNARLRVVALAERRVRSGFAQERGDEVVDG